MNNTATDKKKKLINIFIAVGIVGGILVGLVAMMGYTSFLAYSLVGEFDKYVYLAEKFEDSSKCIVNDEKNEIRGAVVLRDGMSDYYEKHDACIYETTSIFTGPNGDFPLSRGIWCAVTKLDESGEIKPLKNSFALVDLNKAIANGYGEKLKGYIQEDEQAKFAIKKYAIKDLVCVPMEIVVYSKDDQLLESIHCNVDEDISGFTIAEAEDVYLSTLNLKTNLESALASDRKSGEYAQKALEATDLSVDGVSKNKSVYPTKAVVNSVSIENGYAFVYSAVVDTASSAYIIFAIAVVLWLVLVAIIGAVIVAKSKKSSGQNAGTRD